MKAISADAQISLKSILFATDFSPASRAALSHALSIARKYGSKLYPTHVIRLSPFPNSSLTLAWQEISAQATREAQEAMEALEPSWAGIQHEAVIRKGQIWTELARVVAEKEIDLIVTGTRGRAGVSRLMLGSVAEDIFRHAPCPVLTVGLHASASPRSAAESHEILYATDLTPHSLAAAPYALSLALENQARLSLLYVVKDEQGMLSPDVSWRAQLQEIIPADAEFCCRPNCFVRYGFPEVEILGLAQERAVDLIVLGVRSMHGISGLSTHLPWTIASRIVNQALCPVLTIRG